MEKDRLACWLIAAFSQLLTERLSMLEKSFFASCPNVLYIKSPHPLLLEKGCAYRWC